MPRTTSLCPWDGVLNGLRTAASECRSHYSGLPTLCYSCVLAGQPLAVQRT